MTQGTNSRVLRWMRQANEATTKPPSKKVFRVGKTRRERSSGAAAKRLENRDLRVGWQHDDKSTILSFPFHTCNGKKNRNEWTGKGGKRVIVEKRVTN